MDHDRYAPPDERDRKPYRRGNGRGRHVLQDRLSSSPNVLDSDERSRANLSQYQLSERPPQRGRGRGQPAPRGRPSSSSNVLGSDERSRASLSQYQLSERPRPYEQTKCSTPYRGANDTQPAGYDPKSLPQGTKRNALHLDRESDVTSWPEEQEPDLGITVEFQVQIPASPPKKRFAPAGPTDITVDSTHCRKRGMSHEQSPLNDRSATWMLKARDESQKPQVLPGEVVRNGSEQVASAVSKVGTLEGIAMEEAASQVVASGAEALVIVDSDNVPEEIEFRDGDTRLPRSHFIWLFCGGVGWPIYHFTKYSDFYHRDRCFISAGGLGKDAADSLLGYIASRIARTSNFKIPIWIISDDPDIEALALYLDSLDYPYVIWQPKKHREGGREVSQVRKNFHVLLVRVGAYYKAQIAEGNAKPPDEESVASEKESQ